MDRAADCLRHHPVATAAAVRAAGSSGGAARGGLPTRLRRRELRDGQGSARDFDGCWEAEDVDPDALDPVLLDFRHPRAAQKAKFGGEMFVASLGATPEGTRFLDFFQIDRNTGDAKGIVAIDLGAI
jgi:hypothetical protein